VGAISLSYSGSTGQGMRDSRGSGLGVVHFPSRRLVHLRRKRRLSLERNLIPQFQGKVEFSVSGDNKSGSFLVRVVGE